MTRPVAHLTLFAALFLVSTSGPFIVEAGVDAYAVVFWRTALAAPIFLGYAAARGELRLAAEHRVRTVIGALLLAAHFVLWIKAFDLTDYASNLLLLVSQPIIAAALGIKLGEPPTRDTYISIGLAIAGLAIIAGGDFALGPRALAGDAMCVLGGVAITLFYVVTREARAATPLSSFMGVTMVVCAVASLPIALAVGAPMHGYGARAWGWLAALVVLTTVGGHGLMNLAARHFRLYALNVVIVLEPAIGIALGALMFGARVTALQVAGGALLAGAVFVGLRPERAANAPSRAAA